MILTKFAGLSIIPQTPASPADRHRISSRMRNRSSCTPQKPRFLSQEDRKRILEGNQPQMSLATRR